MTYRSLFLTSATALLLASALTPVSAVTNEEIRLRLKTPDMTLNDLSTVDLKTYLKGVVTPAEKSKILKIITQRNLSETDAVTTANATARETAAQRAKDAAQTAKNEAGMARAALDTQTAQTIAAHKDAYRSVASDAAMAASEKALAKAKAANLEAAPVGA